jgi:hypothetical protein
MHGSIFSIDRPTQDWQCEPWASSVVTDNPVFYTVDRTSNSISFPAELDHDS